VRSDSFTGRMRVCVCGVLRDSPVSENFTQLFFLLPLSENRPVYVNRHVSNLPPTGGGILKLRLTRCPTIEVFVVNSFGIRV
jgi:hypothetical protein